MFGGIPRLVYLGVTRWQSVVLVGASLLIIGSAIAVGSGVPMQEETDLSSEGTLTVEQQHYAHASENTSVYRPGERLSRKSLYLLSEAPNVTIQEVVQTDGGPSTTVDVETEVVYKVQYSESLVYQSHGVSSHSNGTVREGNVTTELKLDMVRVRNQLQGLRNDFGSEASVEAVLVTTVEYTSEQSGTIEFQTPVQFTSKGYHVPTTTKSKQYGPSEKVHKPVPERTITVRGITVGHLQIFGLLLAVVGLSIVGGSIRYLRPVTDAEKKELYREVMHRRFSDLIATVQSGKCPPIDREMGSLQELMFVGEDGGAPVLYFPDTGQYVVEHEGVVYGYQFGSSSFVFDNDIE